MLVPVYKRANPSVRGLADPSTVDWSVWGSVAERLAETADATLGLAPESESADAPVSAPRSAANGEPDGSTPAPVGRAALAATEPGNRLDSYDGPVVGRGRGRKGR